MLGSSGSPVYLPSADRSAAGKRIEFSLRLAAAALLAVALGLALRDGLSGGGAPAPARAHRPAYAAISSLSPAARGQISSALGADEPRYRVSAATGGFRAANRPQNLRVAFGSSGAAISSGAANVRIGLSAAGYGSSLTRLSQVAPTARANRVTYDHGWVTEWYANGPIGIEQGFALSKAPPRRSAGPLTLSLTLHGNVRATLASDGRGIALSHSGAALKYDGLTASDAHGRELHSWLSLWRGHVLLRIDTRGARFPLRIDPFIHQGPKLTATGEIGNGGFGGGEALSADGTTALIGASEGQQPNHVGEAFVFTYAGGVWTQQQRLTGNGLKFEQFGARVALSADGNTALIGTSRAGIAPAFVFTRTGGVWTKQKELLPPGQDDQGDFSKVALSADGNTAMVGEPEDGFSTGSVSFFTRSGGVWTLKQKLTGSGVVGFGAFGARVALSANGKTALIAEPGDGTEEGTVFVYTLTAKGWGKQQTLTAGGFLFGEGIALSADGQTALVSGQPAANTDQGIIVFYARSGNVFTPQLELIPPGVESGASVALSSDGNLALVGARLDERALVFTRSGGTWTETQELTPTGAGSADFGFPVVLSSDGSTAFVGAFEDNGGLGAAWPYVESDHPALAHLPSVEVPRAGPRYVAPNEPVELAGPWQIDLSHGATAQGTISCRNVTLGGALLNNGARKDSLSIARADFGGTAGCTSTSPLGRDVALTAGLATDGPSYQGFVAINGKSRLTGNPEVTLEADFTDANGAPASCTWQAAKLNGAFSAVEGKPISIQLSRTLKLDTTISDAACPTSGRLSASEALYTTDEAGNRTAVFLSG
jgi:hypothetical protein